MSLLAVELNDAALVVARAGDVDLLPASPGYALLQDGQVLVGMAAAGRARITPLYAQNRYWHQLGLEKLPWSAPRVQTHADLAFAQLANLIETAAPPAGSGLLFAVPPGLSREQLGLLVGIGNETGLVVRGLVDIGVAACAARATSPHVLHLDLQLHQAVVTVLEHARAEGALRRARYEILPGAGLLSIQQSMVETVATLFVRKTRFDPLHEAATEQALVDALPGWLAALADHDATTAEIAAGSRVHSLTIERSHVIGSIEHRLADLQRLVQASRPAGLAVELCVSAQAAAVPGLLDRLATLRDCRVTLLPPGAAARGALEFSHAIARSPEAVTLVHRLPIGSPAGAQAEAVAALAPLPAAQTPTHVLHADRAYAISEQPLVLGSAVAGPGRALPLPPGTPGVSRAHCTLFAREGMVQVEDHSTYGTFVNDERVTGRLVLEVGDVLRLGAPGVSLSLIRVLPDDGAP
jgi:hypothetical protein